MDRKNIQISLIIPNNLLKNFNFEDNYRLKIRRYLIFALSDKIITNYIQNLTSQSARKQYQLKNVSYTHFSLRFPEDLWSLITEFSHGTGLSRCKIVTELLKLYLENRISGGVTPLELNYNLIFPVVKVILGSNPGTKNFWKREITVTLNTS